MCYGQRDWRLGLLAVGLLLVQFLGYGDDYVAKLGKYYWPYIFILGLTYGLCQFGLCLHFGGYLLLILSSGLCSLVFGFGMYLSKKFTQIDWKYCELATGGAVGLVAALVIYFSS